MWTMAQTSDGGDGNADGMGISERIERLEAIAETLEAGEVGLETATELREEADDHLEALRDELDVGDGEIIELEAEDADLDEE
jgi:exonuclease VII small subunit